jgi:HEAT repeat protein
VDERALESGKDHTKEFIKEALGGLRDERAARLFVYILTHTGFSGPLEAAYVSTIESLGRIANDEHSVDALKDILYRGEWYAPGRTTRIRAAAAKALRAMSHPSAENTLNEAASGGPRGVRRAARAALEEPAPVRAPRRQQT